MAAYSGVVAAITAAGTSATQAGVILSDMELFDQNVLDQNATRIPIDVNGDGIDDLALERLASYSGETLERVFLRVAPVPNGNASVVIDTMGAGPYSNPTAALESGFAISQDLTFSNANGYAGLAQFYRVNPDGGGASTSYGAWIGGVTNQFLGVKVRAGSEDHLAFIQLSVEPRETPDAPFRTTIAGFEFNEASVTASNGLGLELLTKQVPEPSGLAMMALGAVGIQAMRRRKRSRAADSK